MPATFNETDFTYSIDGEEVEAIAAKGASDSIARDAQARLSTTAARLGSGTITLQEGYETAKRDTKMLHMAEAALARGGFDNMGPSEWERVEAIVSEQWSGNARFPGLRAFFEDIESGRYGRDQLGRGFQSRLLSYGDAGRLTYENERLAARMEVELLEAKRVQGAGDHCPECPAWAALGWIEAHRMLNEYPIGASSCNVHCYCVIVMRRAAIDEANAIGWHALPAAIGRVAKTSATVAVGVLALFQFARANPALMRSLLGLLAQALGARTV